MKQVGVNVAPVPIDGARRQSIAGDFLALTKPRLNLLVVLTSAAGYYLGSEAPVPVLAMAPSACGTALVASGAAVLNQVYERQTDALMRRTRLRPLPDGRVGPVEASVFGLILSLAGLVLLAVTANRAAALLALATLIVYLVIYTPMKRRSTAATLVGAVPGALPPLIGWAASHGTVSVGGWILFGIVFLWQIPHFMAIAWMYRDDYRSAGFPMLPVVEPDGRRTGRQAVVYTAALVPVTLAVTYAGISGWMYFGVALALGIGLLVLAARFSAERSEAAARWLFFGSITYLPLLWTAMVLDH